MNAPSGCRGAAALALLLSALALALVLTGSRPVQAEGTFISAPGRVDMVYDLKRATLYITTKTWTSANGASTLTDSAVLRYHVPTSTFLPRIPIYGNLMGLDISPDGNTLLVADTFYSADRVWVHQVNLETLEVRKAEVARDGIYEGGTYAVAFGNDGRALVTSTFLGSGSVPLRLYDPASGTWIVFPRISQSTMVSASPDGSIIGYAESNISDGRWGRYRVSDSEIVRREWYENGTSWFNYEIGVKNQGSQYAIPTYGGTYIYNEDFSRKTIVGTYAASQPIGQAYHPFEDLVYFAWADSSSRAAPYVKAHRTTDFAVVAQYDMQTHFDHTGNSAFTEGRLRISRDGAVLFCTVEGGVRFVRTGPNRSVAGDQTVRVLEDASVPVSLYAHSATSQMTWDFPQLPTRGSLSGNPPDLLYTPSTDASGIDRFQFRIYDGAGYSNTATVSVLVTPVNDAPSFQKGADQTAAQGSGAQSVPGWATQISPGPADEMGQSLTFLVANNNPNLFAVPPAVSPTGTLTFTPASTAVGTATVTVRLQDSGGRANGGVDTSAAQTFTITITPQGQPPVAGDDTAETAEDTPVLIDVLANDSDPEGGALSFSVGRPSHGVVEPMSGKVRYMPFANFNGTDRFQYTVRDSTGQTDTATVQVTVTPVNDAPVATPQSASTGEDTPKSLTLAGTDVEGSPLAFTVASGPSHGTLSGMAPDLTYTPNADYHGPDSFTFTVSDGELQSAPATVGITVDPANDAPAARDDEAATNEDTAVTLDVLANDSDVDGDSLTLASVTQGSQGAVINDGTSVRYVPNRDANGTDSFTYTVKDPSGATSTATVRVTVVPVNDPPLARGQAATTAEDTPRTLTLTGFDPDGDPLTYAIASAPAHGTLEGTLPNVVYTPASNFSGPDSFTFTVSDGQATSQPGLVTITVTPVNDAPIAVADSASTAKNTAVTIPVLANDSDPDGDALTLASVSAAASGSAVMNADGTVRYTPKKGFSGTDTFTYSVSDGHGGTAAATVTVTVGKR